MPPKRSIKRGAGNKGSRVAPEPERPSHVTLVEPAPRRRSGENILVNESRRRRDIRRTANEPTMRRRQLDDVLFPAEGVVDSRTPTSSYRSDNQIEDLVRALPPYVPRLRLPRRRDPNETRTSLSNSTDLTNPSRDPRISGSGLRRRKSTRGGGPGSSCLRDETPAEKKDRLRRELDKVVLEERAMAKSLEKELRSPNSYNNFRMLLPLRQLREQLDKNYPGWRNHRVTEREIHYVPESDNPDDYLPYGAGLKGAGFKEFWQKLRDFDQKSGRVMLDLVRPIPKLGDMVTGIVKTIEGGKKRRGGRNVYAKPLGLDEPKRRIMGGPATIWHRPKNYKDIPEDIWYQIDHAATKEESSRLLHDAEAKYMNKRPVGAGWLSDIADSFKTGIDTAFKIKSLIGMGLTQEQIKQVPKKYHTKLLKHMKSGGSWSDFTGFLKRYLPVPYLIARTGEKIVTGKGLVKRTRKCKS